MQVGPFQRSTVFSGTLVSAGMDEDQTFEDFVLALMLANNIELSTVESTIIKLFDNIQLKGQGITKIENNSIKTTMERT